MRRRRRRSSSSSSSSSSSERKRNFSSLLVVSEPCPEAETRLKIAIPTYYSLHFLHSSTYELNRHFKHRTMKLHSTRASICPPRFLSFLFINFFTYS